MKIRLSTDVPLLNSMHTLKTHGVREVKLQTFLNSALDGVIH